MQVKAIIVAFSRFTARSNGGLIRILHLLERVRCAAQSLASGRKPRTMNTRIPFGIAGGRAGQMYRSQNKLPSSSSSDTDTSIFS
jgi:hypothetical protein